MHFKPNKPEQSQLALKNRSAPLRVETDAVEGAANEEGPLH